MLISIVGIEHIPLGYYRDKVEVERVVESSGVPFTILRATQVHDLVEQLFAVQRALPVVLAPAFDLQPIAPEDVGGRLAELAGSAPAGRVPDIGGPAVRPLPELARVWTAARNSRRRVVPLRAPGRVFAGYRAGRHLFPARRSAGSPSRSTWPVRRERADAGDLRRGLIVGGRDVVHACGWALRER